MYLILCQSSNLFGSFSLWLGCSIEARSLGVRIISRNIFVTEEVTGDQLCIPFCIPFHKLHNAKQIPKRPFSI